MRMPVAMVVVLTLGLVSCDRNKPYSTSSGEGLDYTVVIDGVDVGSWRKFAPPAGATIEVGSTLALRYQTPCGVRDVPMKVTRIVNDEHTRDLVAEPTDGQKPPHQTKVLVDARGGGEVDLRIGAARVKPKETVGTRDLEKAGAWFGEALDLDCAKTHEVSLGGQKVGTLGERPTRPQAGTTGYEDVVWVSPKKDACFVATYPSVRSTRDGNWAGESGGWDDVLLRGPGWLPFLPDVFMQEPTDGSKPKAVVERPCPPPG